MGPRISKKMLSLSGGIILSIGAIILINTYIKEERNKMYNNLKKTFMERYKNLNSVIVAKKDIPAGAEIVQSMIETKVIPNEYIQPKSVTSADRIIGMKTVVAINKGEQITLSKLMSPTMARGESLAMATPVGKRAITVSVDNISGLVGMIKPGDYVDVIALLPLPVKTPEGTKTTNTTIPLFQKVLVLAVGEKLLEKKEKGKTGLWSLRLKQRSTKEEKNPLITLALSPQEASLLSFVVEQGRIRLVLRSPADAKVKPLPPAGWDTLFQYINSTLPQVEVKPLEPKKLEPKKIEIYRGLNKEYISISE